MSGRLLTIAGIFLPLSLATVGGGQSAVPGIRHAIVEEHHWMTPAQFVDAFALSRMAPGPGSLLVTVIGWKVDGWAGALVATLAIFGPTSIAILLLARFWASHRGARWQRALEQGLRPVAAGLMMAASYILLVDLNGGWIPRAVAIIATVVLLRTQVAPLVTLSFGALACIGFHQAGLLSLA